jgi:Polysaccharide deacetylase
MAGAAACVSANRILAASEAAGTSQKAQIVITLDLEMARNFPNWDDTHWDYEKGNLDQASKVYVVEACRRVKQRGGLIHTFVVGQVLEQENVDWLKEVAREGHPIGNHTYDHVYLLAKSPDEIQYRFQRSPWLIRDRPVAEVLRENIRMTNVALKERIGVEVNGFRTPGGFSTGLAGREDLQKMLLDLGFKWVSGKYPAHAGIEDLHGTGRKPSKLAFDGILAAQSEAQPFVYPTGLIELPMSPISDVGAFRNGRWKLDDFLEATRQCVEWVIQQRAVFDFLAHPSVLGVVDPTFKSIDLICDLVERSSDYAEIVPLDVIAQRVHA